MNQTATRCPEIEAELEEARAELERRVRAGTLHQVEELSGQFPRVWSDPECALELAYSEYVLRKANGEAPLHMDWYLRFPEWRERLERLFGLHELFSARDTLRNRSDRTMPTVGSFESLDLDDHPTGYELFEELGRGGMAVVYRARQRDLNRIVALKVLRGGEWFETEDVARLRDEAEAVAKLHHPNIVQIHMIGDWDGVPFLAMEYVDGGTLGEFLTRNQRQGTLGVSPKQAAELVATLARGMQYAHDNGIIHRDLKPANVLLRTSANQPFAEPKIADFGLAIREDLSITITQTSRLAGTPCYMAPEQADSRRDVIGPKTDVYALGGILYELLTGRPPFQAATVLETLDLVRSAEPVPPRTLQPSIPRDLETICLKCLQKLPDRRYPTATALAEDIDNFREGRPIVARPVSWIEKSLKAMRRYPLVSGLALSIIGLIGLSIGLLFGMYRTSETARIQEQYLRQELEATRAQELIASANAHWAQGEVSEARRLLTNCPVPYRSSYWDTLRSALFAEETSASIKAFGPMVTSPSGKLVAIQETRSKNHCIIDRVTGSTLATVPHEPFVKCYHYFSQDDIHFYSIPISSSVPTRGSTQFGPIVRSYTMTEWDLQKGCHTSIRQLPQPNAFLDINSTYGLLMSHRYGERAIEVSRILDGQSVWKLPYMSLGGLGGAVFCIGNLNLITIHEDAVICWNSSTGEKIRTAQFRRHHGQAPYIGSPCGKLLYYRDGTALYHPSRLRSVIAWSLESGKEAFRIEDTEGYNEFKLDQTGAFLAVRVDRKIRLYDARNGKHLVDLYVSKSTSPTFEFLPNNRLVTASQDLQLKTWNLSDWVKPDTSIVDK